MRWRTIPVRVPDRAFLTLKQVCAAVGVRDKVLREWIRLGVFPPGEVIGGVRRWENKVVGLWLEIRRYMPILDCSPGRPQPQPPPPPPPRKG